MVNRIGYGRSTSLVNVFYDQLDALSKADCSYEGTFVEKFGSAGSTNPKLKLCLSTLQIGDTLVVWTLDRVERSFPKLLRIFDEVRQKGVAIEVLEPFVRFDDSLMGQSLYGMLSMCAEFLSKNSRLSIASEQADYKSRSRGTKGRRPPALNVGQISKIMQRLEDPAVRIKDLAIEYRVSRTTLHKYIEIEKLKAKSV